MSKVRSAKAKRRRLQNLVRDKLREAFPSLHEDDIQSQTMGMNGEDIIRTPAARKKIPFTFECKNVERLQIWKAIEQCDSNNHHYESPAVVFKKNRKDPYVAIPLYSFIDLIKEK